MSLTRAFRGETYRTSVRSWRSPASALRTRRSMQARKAAKVLPEPVGAEISVVRPARMCGHPCSWGSVGVPNRWTNQSRTRGCAQARGVGTDDILHILAGKCVFVKCSLIMRSWRAGYEAIGTCENPDEKNRDREGQEFAA